MRPPRFWQHGHTPPPILRPILHLILNPLGWLYAAATARRVARPGWIAPVPVICCGNAGAGGSGKTPLALDLAGRLIARGERPAFLTRGHGGALATPSRVAPSHTAADVGDEALLLAACAPTYVGADRAATARLAVADGATVLVMDDGLQNPGLAKTLALLVIDGGAGFGNGSVIPAGPLREPVAAAASRCQAAVLIGTDRTDVRASLGDLPILAADILPNAADLASLPSRLLAFAGIGRPTKFFDTLRDAGHTPVDTLEFPDHHPYTGAELAQIRALASRLNAHPVTTNKDLMRIPPRARAGFQSLGITLAWQNPAAIDALLDQAMQTR
jgi:tetraacyldisaccharide 4'-kinase